MRLEGAGPNQDTQELLGDYRGSGQMDPLVRKVVHLRNTWVAREGESRKDPYTVERPHELQGFPHPTSLVTAVPGRPEWGS